MVIGVDFGSKLAGTTAIAFLDDHQSITTLQSEKKKDADAFVNSFISNQVDELSIYIDAPLSLPGVFAGIPGYSNYFYRRCDQEVQAMSPMFLGGLTARAMKLKAESGTSRVSFFEAYPKLMAKEIGLIELGYKKTVDNLQATLERISNQSGYTLKKTINSWHELDAILALLIGLRHEAGGGIVYGDSDEGLIYG